MPGRRGSRACGRRLNAHATRSGKGPHADAVAIGDGPWTIIHPVGSTARTCRPTIAIKPPEVYDIPLRSLYSKNVRKPDDGGPHISASTWLYVSPRHGDCSVIGQALGNGRGAMRRARTRARRSRPELRNTSSSFSRPCCATTRHQRHAQRGSPRSRAARRRSARRPNCLQPKPRMFWMAGVAQYPDEHGETGRGPLLGRPHGRTKAGVDRAPLEPGANLRQIQITFRLRLSTGAHPSAASDSVDVNIVRRPSPKPVKHTACPIGAADGAVKKLLSVDDNHSACAFIVSNL